MTDDWETSAFAFKPDWCSPPGDTIEDVLESRGISRENFAKLIQLDKEGLEDLLIGKMVIDIHIADELMYYIGGSTQFWLQREKNYREHPKCPYPAM